MIHYIIMVIAIIIAGSCKAIMDTLQFHYYISHWIKFNPKFWNSELSWKNKYKDGIKENGPKFFGSTTFLVFLTDAWHLFQMIFHISIFIAIVSYKQMVCPIADFGILFGLYLVTFNIVYK